MTILVRNKPWYREPLVWMLLTPPAAAIIAGFFTLYLAIVSYDGLVVDDYYQHGKTINQVIYRDQAAVKHGLRGELQFDPKAGFVQLNMSAQGLSVLPQTVRLKLFHTTRATFDQIIELHEDVAGIYSAALPTLVPGNWNVQLEAEDWRLIGALSLPKETYLALGGSH